MLTYTWAILFTAEYHQGPGSDAEVAEQGEEIAPADRAPWT